MKNFTIVFDIVFWCIIFYLILVVAENTKDGNEILEITKQCESMADKKSPSKVGKVWKKEYIDCIRKSI